MRHFLRPGLIALALTAALVLCVGIAVPMRGLIVEGIVIREMASRGINAQLQVTELTWNEALIEDIALEEARIGRLHLSFSLRELIGGQIRTAEIEGLTASVDLADDGPPLGRLQNLFPETGPSLAPGEAADTPPVQLPRITVRNAQISVNLPDRNILLSASGDLVPDNGGGELSVDFEGTSGAFLTAGRINAAFDGTAILSFVLESELRNSDNTLVFALNGESAPLALSAPELQLHVYGEEDLASLASLMALDETLTPLTGSFRLILDGTLRFPLGFESPIDSAQGDATYSLLLSDTTLPNSDTLPAWMSDRINAEISGTLALQEARITSALSADIGYSESETTLEFVAPEAHVGLNEDFTLRSLDLTNFVASAQSVPTPYGTLRTIVLEGELSDLLAAPSGALQIHATSPELTLSAISARSAVIDANMSLSSTDAGYQLTLNAPARYSFGTLHLPALLPIGAFNGQVLTANLDLTVGQDDTSFHQTARVSLPNLSLEAERRDAPPLAFQIESQPVDIASTGTIGTPIPFTTAARLDSFGITELNYLAEDAELSVQGTIGGNVSARLQGGSITHATESPLHTPLAPDLTMDQNGDRLSFAGDLSGANGFLNISVQGEHDLATRLGNMRFAVDELVFGPGGTMGSAVSPLLASLENLRGQMEGEANFGWDEAGLDHYGRVGAELNSFRQGGIAFEDLTTELDLDRLLPLRSLPNQALTVRRIEMGIEDLTSVDLRFMLDANEGGAPRILTETLAMDIAGGRITSEGGTFDPATGESNVPLMAENIDLARLLSHIGLEELTGEGRLNGPIPFRIGADGASIEGAMLQADSAGLVTYRSPRAREALASGGDAVNLMLDALEDFHYDSLDLTLSKPAAGDTAITLRLAGNNPAVLEGHPFDINISLTGDAEPLLQALLAGQRLSNELLRSMTEQ